MPLRLVAWYEEIKLLKDDCAAQGKLSYPRR